MFLHKKASNVNKRLKKYNLKGTKKEEIIVPEVVVEEKPKRAKRVKVEEPEIVENNEVLN